MPSLSIRLIESDKERAHYLAQILENTVILNGNICDVKVLHEANVSQADMFVAVSNDDAANILSSLLTKNLGSARSTTLVSNMMYPKFLPVLGIDSIMNPGLVTISSLLNHIRRGDMRTAHVLPGELGEIVEVSVESDSGVEGQRFSTLNIPDEAVVGGVTRNGLFFIPKSQDPIHAKDHLVILVTNRARRRVERLFRGP